MFQLKTKTIELDGNLFTVTEPLASDVVDMNKITDDVAKPLFLISRCVSLNGVALGDNAQRMPARYMTALSEMVGEMAGIGGGND